MRLLDKAVTRLMVLNRLIVTGIVALLQISLFCFIFLRFVEVSAFVTIALDMLSLMFIIWLAGNEEPSSYRISWIIVIVALPLMGALLFLLWGDKKASKSLKDKIDKSVAEIVPLLEKDKQIEGLFKQDDYRAYTSSRYLRNVTHYPVFNNTTTKYYSLGEYCFDDMLEELAKAEHFIFMEYFIIEEGEMWGKILEILVKKAKIGVKIRIMYDDMGCLTTLTWAYRKFLEEMHENIKCVVFNRVNPAVALKMNNRDHRKILVIDGKVGFTGGINIADEYINQKVKYGHWKDTAVRIEGPAVWGMTCLFLEIWNAFSDEYLNPNMYKFKSFGIQTKGFVQPFGDNPLNKEAVGQNVYIDMINQANESIFIMTPYLILDDITRNAIILAAYRGVDVNILTPGIPDKKPVFRITRSNYVSLIKVGVKVFEYTEGFLHAKSIVVDQTIGMIGTINLDYRSMYINFECGVYMYNTDAVTDLYADTIDTIAHSTQISLEDLHLNLWEKGKNAILRIFAPLM